MNVAFKERKSSTRALDAIAEALLLPSGIDGIYARTASFEDVVNGLTSLISRNREPGAEVLRFPPVMSRRQLEKSGYLKSFPHFLGCVCCLDGDEAQIRGAVDRFEAGEDWTPGLSPADLVLSPAACYPVYPLAASRGDVPAEGLLFDVASDCFRREPSKDLDRLQSFRMREFVRMGTPEQIDDFRQRWMIRAQEIAAQLGLTWRIDHASDPFFGRGGKLMAVSQVEQALKFELLVPVRSAEEPTACMSFNNHRDHFGGAWNLPARRRRGRAYRLRCLRHRSPGVGALRHARHRVAALADRGAQGARGLIGGKSRLNPQQRVFGISEIAEAGTPRPLEIFRHAAATIHADQPRYRTVRVDDDDGSCAQREISPERSSKAGEVIDVGAIDQLRAGQDRPHQARPEHEGVGAFGRRAPQADAAMRGMLQQDLPRVGIEFNLGDLLRIEYLDAGIGEQSVEQRQRDEDAFAIAGKTLCLDDRSGVRRRRDVQIGDVLVPQRLRHQQARIGAELRFDVPARQVAAGGGSLSRPHRRADDQDRADRNAAAFHEVTVFRQARRRIAAHQPGEGAQPEAPIAIGESAREQRGHSGDIGLTDQTAA